MDVDLLAFSGYPSLGQIVSSVALTFFAFLGFGVITFTAKDLADPARQLPRAVYLALGIATIVYVAVALGVFGTLTVDEVIASGGTALAVAAEPVLGSAGYWLMTVTALFATAGATNSGLYPATGLGDEMAAVGQFPPVMSRRVGRARVHGHRRHVGRGDRPRRLLRPERDRLDRQRRRAGRVHAGDLRPLPDPARDRRQGMAADPGRPHDPRGPGRVRCDDPRRRAGHRRGAGGDPAAQRRAGPRLEEPPGRTRRARSGADVRREVLAGEGLLLRADEVGR